MPVKIISDLHSAASDLSSAVSPADTLILLGDLVNLVDYLSVEGVLVDLYGRNVVERIIQLRSEGKFEQAHEYRQTLRAGREEELTDRFEQLMRREYENVFASVPRRTYAIWGNVDSPDIMRAAAPDFVTFANGKVLEIEGLRYGFVGGGLPTPMKVRGEIPEEEFDAKLAGLDELDVICTHMPPRIPEMSYDILAGRPAGASKGLLKFIQERKPRAALFGHVHQPLISAWRLGPTYLLNCGYFRKTKVAIMGGYG